jgi:hypothetical protein
VPYRTGAGGASPENATARRISSARPEVGVASGPGVASAPAGVLRSERPPGGPAGVAGERGVLPRQYKDKSPREQRPRGDRAAKHRQIVGAVVPKHCQHCAGIGSRDWWLWRRKRTDLQNVTRSPYYCKSWRCPACARGEAAVTFARIRDAFAPLDPAGVCFVVLTLDRDGFYSGKPWRSARDAFRALSSMSCKFLKRLNRMCRARGWRPIGNRWVATVEAHRSGWPHVNFILHCPELALELVSESRKKLAQGASDRESTLLGGELIHHALETGWGPQSTAERGRDAGALAGYIVKLAGEAGAVVGEVAKLTQLPHGAPVRFRRLRAGKGFLAPRHRNPDVTGTLVRRLRERDGTVTVLPLHKVSAADQSWVLACCYQEETIAIDELSSWKLRKMLARLGHGRLLDTPPVSVWRVGASSERGPPPFVA